MKKLKNDKIPPSFSIRSIGRGLLLVFLPLIAYVLIVFPLIFLFGSLMGFNSFLGLRYYFFTAVILVVCFIFFILLGTFIPGLFIRIFRIRVTEGEYFLSVHDKGFFLHLLFFLLYRPSLKLVGIVPLVPLRLAYLKLVGLSIGKGSLVAGTELIDEPYAVRIGDNSLIGGYSVIYTHSSFKKMIMKSVRIGNNCFIGNKAIIMPGVKIEDDVIVKPGSLVESDSVLKKGGVYQGNPARLIDE
jgi:hypothetical protein